MPQFITQGYINADAYGASIVTLLLPFSQIIWKQWSLQRLRSVHSGQWTGDEGAGQRVPSQGKLELLLWSVELDHLRKLHTHFKTKAPLITFLFLFLPTVRVSVDFGGMLLNKTALPGINKVVLNWIDHMLIYSSFGSSKCWKARSTLEFEDSSVIKLLSFLKQTKQDI